MQGYDVCTFDGHKIGHVVDVDGEFIVFEHGLRKTHHALPSVAAQVDNDDRVVNTHLSKKLIYESPKVEGELDRQSIAEHYGLAEAFTDPPTRANGDGVRERVAARHYAEN